MDSTIHHLKLGFQEQQPVIDPFGVREEGGLGLGAIVAALH